MATQAELQASVTKTGVFNGASIDISGYNTENTLHIEVDVCTGGCQISIEDSVNAFSASIIRHVFVVKGNVVAGSPVKFSVSWRNSGVRFGTGSAVLRVNVDEVGTTVTYRASAEKS